MTAICYGSDDTYGFNDCSNQMAYTCAFDQNGPTGLSCDSYDVTKRSFKAGEEGGDQPWPPVAYDVGQFVNVMNPAITSACFYNPQLPRSPQMIQTGIYPGSHP